MTDDNTPEKPSRRRASTSHMHLRNETAKRLQILGSRAKSQRIRSKNRTTGEKGPENAKPRPKIPQMKKNTLSGPVKPVSKFRKRQVHKSWLPTHLYHAKRAHITAPAQPLWRFAVPLTPTDKTYRKTHRAVSSRGCVAWDTSYMSTLRLEGVDASLLNLLRGLGVEETMLKGRVGAKWRRGTRIWDGWIRERDGERRFICKILIIWCLSVPEIEMDRDVAPTKKRQIFFRVHPSAFLQVWKEALRLAKIQRPQVVIEDQRFEMGSIEITGPGSTEALIGILSPIGAVDGAVQPDIASEVWPALGAVTNPASLPPNILLGFVITDPRLRYPPRKVKQSSSAAWDDKLLQILSIWPPDTTVRVPAIFDRSARFTASKLLTSQKAINRRKGAALPGAYPDPRPEDPQIPVLLIACRSPSAGGQGSWIVLLPWKCVLPVWYSLMYYPLSSGGNPLFGGLQEKRQIAFEQRTPWFPGDFPGTSAGWEWEVMERGRRKAEWEKRPKGKRVEWDSVDLGVGEKGEIGIGWACDWERLFQGPAPSSPVTDPTQHPSKTKATSQAVSQPHTNPQPQSKPAEQDPPNPPSPPPLNIHHLPSQISLETPPPATALTTISLSHLARGSPTTCARIYRLPTSNPQLRQRWLALAHSSKSPKQNLDRKRASFAAPKKDRPPHQVQAQLAASLFAPRTTTTTRKTMTTMEHRPESGDANYPSVPGEGDLIGFVTTGNFNLSEGRGSAIGCVALARVLQSQGGIDGYGKDNCTVRRDSRLCIVREAGQALGRLARWEFT